MNSRNSLLQVEMPVWHFTPSDYISNFKYKLIRHLYPFCKNRGEYVDMDNDENGSAGVIREDLLRSLISNDGL
ncbi:MAG TPA: hypothetical protein VFQ73_05055 [Flavisolibacter sp.]|nr:hypothetical protein [Flavisolibacter sp.]